MRLIIGVLALLPLIAAAETAYVTDNLRLGLHRAQDTSDRAFRFLDSGQPMEILIRGGSYASVRLPDGAEGWVKLVAELEQARQAFAEPAATIDGLRNDAAVLTTELENAKAQVAELQAEVESIQGMKERYRGSVPLNWVGGAILVCLIAGFLCALWWVDHRSRKRHGGIRIY
jgi:SH3-like domain-containing protein